MHGFRIWAICTAILFLGGWSCAQIEVTESPAETVEQTSIHNKQGIHLLLDDGRTQWPVELWEEHMRYAHQVTGDNGYVTEVITIDDLDSAKWQTFMDLCKRFKLIPIVRLATTFDNENNYWVAPKADKNGRYQSVASQYASFVANLSWPTDQHIIVIGNEPNHGNEWSGKPDPAAYARFLVDVADAVHEADSNAFILNAGMATFTPNTGSKPFVDGMYYVDAESFLNGMVAAEPDVFSKLDGWASHPYPLGPFAVGPWEQTFQIDLINDAANSSHRTPPDGVFNRGVNGYEWELWFLEQHGITNLPVYITETGWRHSIDGFPDAETAAVYIDLALHGNADGRYSEMPQTGWTPWLDDSRVIAVTPFALNGNPAEWFHTSWLEMSEDGQVLGLTELAGR